MVERSLKNRSNWKAPGPDSIFIGIIKAGGHILLKILTKIF